MLADKKVSTMYDATDDRYYEEIDKEMAKLFPQDQSNSNVQTVAPVNGRASAKTGRKQRVVLTESCERRTAESLVCHMKNMHSKN